jgi:23S rRNA pseudouridine1911/1915/1917 synthase
VNGETIFKPSHQLSGDELVEIHLPEVKETELLPEPIPLDILFEDDNLIVVNKRAGMVVHPSIGHPSGTLVNAILAHTPDIEGVGGVKRPGVVHRLDKDTSGVILFAKNDRTHQFLQAQFSQRKVVKVYAALVDGIPKTPSGKIDAAIGRSKKDRKKMAVFPRGQARQAVTAYQVVEAFERHTYMQVRPQTGRTHQIRVHLAFIGVPVVGDRVYGRKKPSLGVNRHLLHASEVEIMVPDESGAQTFIAPLPVDFDSQLQVLRESATKWEGGNGS